MPKAVTQSRRIGPKPKTDHDRFCQMSVSEIRPSEQNDKLYRPVRSDDPEIIELSKSIRKNGILQPIGITRDGVIFDGHRRFCAAKVAGLKTVQVRVRDIESTDPYFLKLLAECNRQRVKSPLEVAREAVVAMSDEDAYAQLCQHRAEVSRTTFQAVELDGRKERATITKAKWEMLDAAAAIIDRNRAFWPLSVRAIHYRMADAKPRLHGSKPTRYGNDEKSYKSLIDLLSRARLAGLISMNAISDETRPVSEWNVYGNAGQFLRSEVQKFARGYWRDLMQGQPNHVELLVEKNTVEPILREVAQRYTIPMTSGRGFCSLPPRAAMLKRFRDSGKDRLIIVVVSDFDPEGESICESFARSMRDDFDCDVSAIKAALTWEQTQKLKLPQALKAKETSSRFKAFRQKFGTDVYELEALEPEHLQDIVDDAIRSVLDVEAFNREVEKEKQEAAEIDVTRRQLATVMAGMEAQNGSRSNSGGEVQNGDL